MPVQFTQIVRLTGEIYGLASGMLCQQVTIQLTCLTYLFVNKLYLFKGIYLCSIGIWGVVIVQWLGHCTQDSGVVGSILTPGMVRFWSLGNFFHPNLPQYTQLQMSTDIVGKVPAMAYHPVQESQYNCTLIACSKWNWLSLAFLAT